jgi:plastocyanin
MWLNRIVAGCLNPFPLPLEEDPSTGKEWPQVGVIVGVREDVRSPQDPKDGETDMRTRFTHLRSRALLAVVILVALAAFVAACGGSSSASTTTPTTPAATTGGTATGGTATASAVAIQNFTFTPKTLTVAPGTKVTWTNNDSTPHNIISTVSISLNSATTSTFTSGNLSQGQTFSFKFAKKGVYFYECSIHKALAAMHAEVIVK